MVTALTAAPAFTGVTVTNPNSFSGSMGLSIKPTVIPAYTANNQSSTANQLHNSVVETNMDKAVAELKEQVLQLILLVQNQQNRFGQRPYSGN